MNNEETSDRDFLIGLILMKHKKATAEELEQYSDEDLEILCLFGGQDAEDEEVGNE